MAAAENLATLYTTNPITTVGTNDLMYIVVGGTTDGVIKFIDFAKLFLQPSNNLSDLTSASAGRTNLGLGSAATASTATFLQTANNLSDVPAPATARTNLGLGTAAIAAATSFLQTANNLSDLPSPTTARTNLGLGTIATMPAANFLLVANNLSDLNSVSLARTNLGLGTIATLPAANFLTVANNLSDLNSATTARTNLGLGSSATTPSTNYLQTANNLSDLASLSAAQTNLGLAGSAFEPITFFLQKANNLSDLASVSAAQTNLGIGSAGLEPISFFLQVANNLSDLTNAASARAALGLGTAATMSSAAFLPASTSYLVPANNLSDLTSASSARTNLGLGTAATLNSTAFMLSANNLSDVASITAARTNLAVPGIFTGTGTPVGHVSAINPGDIYVDTNLQQTWFASASGNSNWLTNLYPVVQAPTNAGSIFATQTGAFSGTEVPMATGVLIGKVGNVAPLYLSANSSILASDASGNPAWASVGTGLTLSGGTLSASGSTNSSLPVINASSIARTNVAGTYANNSGTNATFTITGTSFTNDGILYNSSTIGLTIAFLNQSSLFQNGKYALTSVGTTLIFTRTSDYNTPALFNIPQYIFGNYSGGSFGQSAWYLSTPMVTIGTTNATYAPATIRLSALVTTLNSVPYFLSNGTLSQAGVGTGGIFCSNAGNPPAFTPLLSNTTSIAGLTAGAFKASGYVGAIFKASVLNSAAVNIVSGTLTNLVSIPLPAGNFAVISANIWFSATVGFSGANSWVNTVSATVPDLSMVGGITMASGTINTLGAVAPPQTFSLTAATTVYLSGVVAFTSGTCTISGQLIIEQIP